MLFTILFVIGIVALFALAVVGVQKAKAEKKGIYAEKCPYHNISDEESVVGYETAAPAPAVEEKKSKKKAAKKAPVKKTAPKKANSSQKKK